MKKLSAFIFSVIFYSILAGNSFSQTKATEFSTLLAANDSVSVVTRPRSIIESTKTSAVNIPDLEKLAFALINQKRSALGLNELTWSDEAAKVARLHSKNMAENKFFSHRGLDGLMIGDRADSVGLKKWRAIGENIAYNRGYQKPTEFAVECWIKSDGHRENLLNVSWKETGVGIAIAGDGSYYFTQVFLLRK